MSKRLFHLLLSLSLLSCLGLFVAWLFLPILVPSHWNMSGRVDGFMYKWIVLVYGAIPVAGVLGLRFLPAIDPRRRNYQKHSKAYGAISLAVSCMLILFGWVFTLPGLGLALPVPRLTYFILGMVMVIIGNYMPLLRSNFFAGIRTPWALSNETVWRKTHRAGGIVFCVSGLLMAVSAFLPRGLFLTLPMVALCVGMVGVCLYSYLVYRKLAPGPQNTHPGEAEQPVDQTGRQQGPPAPHS